MSLLGHSFNDDPIFSAQILRQRVTPGEGVTDLAYPIRQPQEPAQPFEQAPFDSREDRLWE